MGLLHELPVKSDARGSLVVMDGDGSVPFPIARVFHLYGMDGETRRGGHAHGATRSFAVCVAGGCTFELDDGARRETIRLDRPDRGLLLPPSLWREMSDFTASCVLMVLADRPYDPADYICDYDQFLRMAARRAA